MSVAIDFSRYHTYAELTAHLEELVAAYPGLAALSSIGKSYEGRELWLVQITNQATGVHDHKPGYYIDANLHAGEVTGTACALYTIWYVLTRYGQDDEITRLLDQTSLYVIPRVSPDGAEKYLTSPYHLRSSVRPYPYDEPQDGLQLEDVDGDGSILQMRFADPDGEWKVSDRDARLMVPRLPHEEGGRYYRLYFEGRIHNYDGVEIKIAPLPWGLDLNRQFPVNWEPEAKQPGAGPFPLSEPETRALAEFLLGQKNTAGGQSYHTTTGVILRPSSLRSDEKMNPKDLSAFRAIGKVGEQLTGYPSVSVHDGFAYQKENPIKGVFLDWCYDHLGILLYSTELWDLRVRAGLARVPFLQPAAERDLEAEGLALLAFNDRELAGEGFVNWYDFEHPQLGPVQLGGWRMKELLQNAPPRFLKAEAHKNALFTLRHAAAAPRLEIAAARAEHLGEGVFRLEAVLKNRGYLPTNITEMAKQNKTARPVTVELSLPEGAELILGKVKEEVGHLEGRVVAMPMFYPGNASVAREKRVEWILKAPGGGAVSLTAVSEKAGRKVAVVDLQAEA